MTNFEKYSNYIDTTLFAVVKGKPVNCFCVYCGECEFWEGRDIKYREEICNKKRMEWLKAEYEGSKKVNIPVNTPINTKLLVSMDGRIWKRRYYAGFKDGIHLAWCDGATSWSKDSDDRKTSWEYMNLYNEEEK